MERIIEIIQGYESQLIALGTAIFIILIRQWLEPKVKIIWGQATNSFHVFPSGKATIPDGSIFTQKFFVKNTGKKPSSEIEMIFKSKPDQVSLYPEISAKHKDLSNGKFALEIPYIAPRGMIIVDTVCIDGKDGKLEQINCKDAVSKKINFTVNRQFPAWFNLSIAAFMFIGFVTVIYWILRMIGI